MIEARVVPGGGRLFRVSALVGVVGVGLTLVSLVWMPDVAYASYLAAYAYWAGIAVSALLLLATFHASSARWMVVVRRLLEAKAVTLPLFALLFVPIALGLGHIFSWARPGAEIGLGHGDPDLIHAKATQWLNPRLFLFRTAIYFVLWIGVAEMLYYWSRRQDESSEVGFTALERRVGAGSLPLLGLAMTFAAFDWLMSLDPTWGSTIFGLYWFAGSFQAAHALLVVVAYHSQQRGWLSGRIQPAHYHSIGKLLFAFTCFWAYIAFCQLLLIWIANEPEEITWYLERIHNGFLPITFILFFGKFVVPFFVLLSRDIKVHPRGLAAIAYWILAAHFVDIYWLVMPSQHHHGAVPRWTDLTALVGIGALATAFAKWRLEGQRILPSCDPYLGESLRYSKP
jgi:hypothetical protein